MITERLKIFSSELETDFSFSIDDNGDMVDLQISEVTKGIPCPRFAILVDIEHETEKYVLSVLESPQTVYFGSNICETIKVFVSNDMDVIFNKMKEEVVRTKGGK